MGADGFLGRGLTTFFQAGQGHSRWLKDSQKFHSASSLLKSLNEIKPKLIVNCMAITNSNYCEEYPEEAFWVNGKLPGLLAEYCRNNEARLIHISTDAVMDTYRSFKCERELPVSSGVYALSKLAGENSIQRLKGDYLICRVNFFGISHKNNSLLDFFIEQIKNERVCHGYTNVMFTPMGIRSLIKCLKELEKLKTRGIIHITGSDRISKYQFGKEVQAQIGTAQALVVEGKLMLEKGQRFRDLSLCNCKLQGLISEPLKSWKVELRDYLSEMRSSDDYSSKRV